MVTGVFFWFFKIGECMFNKYGHFFTTNASKDSDDFFYWIRMSLIRFIEVFCPEIFLKFWKFRIRVAEFIDAVRNSDYRESLKNKGVSISAKHRQFFVSNVVKDFREFQGAFYD
mgnify:CR=1 FL=1